MKHYGIWNSMKKEYQFGIDESTPRKAEKKLFQKIGNDARKWRFEVREIKEEKKMDWKFERTETEFSKIPVGKHRCRIAEAEVTTSKAGNDMIKLTLDISGQSRKVWDYIVFMPDNADITNKKLTAVFDSFGIDADMNCKNWIGKVGACMIKHDENEYEKVNYFLNKKQQENLAAWVEPSSDGDSSASMSTPITDDDIPF